MSDAYRPFTVEGTKGDIHVNGRFHDRAHDWQHAHRLVAILNGAVDLIEQDQVNRTGRAQPRRIIGEDIADAAHEAVAKGSG